METLAILTLLVETANQLLKKMPSYSEKKRKRWEKILVLYRFESVKPKKEWDADLLLNMRDRIIIHTNDILTAAKND